MDDIGRAWPWRTMKSYKFFPMTFFFHFQGHVKSSQFSGFELLTTSDTMVHKMLPLDILIMIADHILMNLDTIYIRAREQYFDPRFNDAPAFRKPIYYTDEHPPFGPRRAACPQAILLTRRDIYNGCYRTWRRAVTLELDFSDLCEMNWIRNQTTWIFDDITKVSINESLTGSQEQEEYSGHFNSKYCRRIEDAVPGWSARWDPFRFRTGFSIPREAQLHCLTLLCPSLHEVTLRLRPLPVSGWESSHGVEWNLRFAERLDDLPDGGRFVGEKEYRSLEDEQRIPCGVVIPDSQSEYFLGKFYEYYTCYGLREMWTGLTSHSRNVSAIAQSQRVPKFVVTGKMLLPEGFEEEDSIRWTIDISNDRIFFALREKSFELVSLAPRLPTSPRIVWRPSSFSAHRKTDDVIRQGLLQLLDDRNYRYCGSLYQLWGDGMWGIEARELYPQFWNAQYSSAWTLNTLSATREALCSVKTRKVRIRSGGSENRVCHYRKLTPRQLLWYGRPFASLIHWSDSIYFMEAF